MLDFLIIATRKTKSGIEVYPKFKMTKSNDLMIRGGDFYAIWLEDRGLWSTDEQDALILIDKYVDEFMQQNQDRLGPDARPLYMWDAESGMIDRWHRYCQKQRRDDYVMLDEKLIFSNVETGKKDYASKRLNYPLEPGEITGWNTLMSTLYSPQERHKIEWAIGSIVTGDSKQLQKFMVLYGSAGTGKSTVLNVVQQLFDGYYSVFDAKALGSSSNAFALEAFKSNPLVAIQHDGDLSKIEDNTRLNSLVSHEYMTINEKFKSTYTNRFKCFLFMGTNKPVKITDAKSGLIRRLIDVTPTGNKLSGREYKAAVKKVSFELGAIASHCQDVYLENPSFYDNYIPITMMGASNDFYNFVFDSYSVFEKEDSTTMKAAWEMYKVYCDEAKVPYPFSQRLFKEELKNYFWEYAERFTLEDGTRVRSYYTGFRTDRFESEVEEKKEEPVKHLIRFDAKESIFDKVCAKCPAQYATRKETPTQPWDEVTSTLSELNTSRLHYVKVPENHIVIDFDIKDADGKKSFEKNLEEASKWPATYAEVSKSGAGIHLHYIYAGDVTKLSRVYDDNIEVKVFSGKSSLRRKLTKCNDLDIFTINSGLPLKGEDKVINFEGVKNEKALRTIIKRNLCKEYHPATKPSIDFINKTLEDAYNSGMSYDVSDMKNAVFAFAAGSTNQAAYCIKLVGKMKFKSEEPSVSINDDSQPIVFYDVEVFPNLFLVNWKTAGEGSPVVQMINPKPQDIEKLIKYRLVGFNCRRYDNHMLYARLLGWEEERIYNLSQKIINSPKGESHKSMFAEAYNLSYTDVYDFAAKKQSLKKWEIELGIHHQELGLPWDQPVPEELWPKVAKYCDNDVIATEVVFDHLNADWTARQILADLSGGSYNDKTNTLTGKLIFGNERKPQSKFQWRNLAEPVMSMDEESIAFLKEVFPDMMAQRHGEAKSLLPYFPGYEYKRGKSFYKGVEVGEGGRVFGKQGMWWNVALLDATSMHPHSAMAEVLFGAKFTRRFYEIVYGRVHIKHQAWEEVNNMLDGKLTPYIQKVIKGEMSSDALADALKIAINSVYGLTAAKFDTLFKDPRNHDNIVAKRGALFMVDLQEEVEKRGHNCVHIKTDSIKIAEATIDIIDFVMDYGKRHGYFFEHEATYDRMCLVNDAVYIAKYASVDWCEKRYGYIPTKQKKNERKWTATGAQFAVPYVFKKLFSKEEIEFSDLCETKEVSKGAIYLEFPSIHEGDETIRTFVGKVGSFCPIKPGCGGALLVKDVKDKEGNVKYDSVTGAKDYYWLEAEEIQKSGMNRNIDLTYYNNLVDKAIEAIGIYGDFEMFVADDIPFYATNSVPPWDGPEAPWDEEAAELFNKR